jgi:hypothetical protein
MAKVAVFVSVGACASIGGTLSNASGVIAEGIIVALSFIGVRRIVAITIPVIVNGTAICLKVMRIASDLSFVMVYWVPFRYLVATDVFSLCASRILTQPIAEATSRC